MWCIAGALAYEVRYYIPVVGVYIGVAAAALKSYEAIMGAELLGTLHAYRRIGVSVVCIYTKHIFYMDIQIALLVAQPMLHNKFIARAKSTVL